MAVAYKQIQEVIDVFLNFVSIVDLKIILERLTKVEAYSKNSSFKETIDRLKLVVGR